MSFWRVMWIGGIVAVNALGPVGCSAKKRVLEGDSTDKPVSMWSRSDALRVLEYAAGSEDAGLRSLALPALSGGENGGDWVQRGWHDPSVAVQRSLAISHGDLLSETQLVRPGADPFAVAWVLQAYPIDDPIRAQVGGVRKGLVEQMLGQGPGINELLTDVEDGLIPPEPMFIDLLVRSGIQGMGEAMATGASRSEEEMRLPLAVASFDVSPEVGLPALDTVLREADAMTFTFAVESVTQVGGERAISWLRRLTKEEGPIRGHAKLGLVALGVRPLDDALVGLSSPDRDVRAWAATCLGIAARNRPLPRNVILALQETWRDESMLVRRAVTRALIRSNGASSVPLAHAPPNAVVDTVAVLVAAGWLSYHDKRTSVSPN